MYLLDSSILIELFEQLPRSQKIAAILKDSSLVTASICMHEVLAGTVTDKERFVLEGLFSTFQILPHDAKAARLGAELYRIMKQQGKMMSAVDNLIAAICKANNAELVTLDKGFQKVKSLNVHIIS